MVFLLSHFVFLFHVHSHHPISGRKGDIHRFAVMRIICHLPREAEGCLKERWTHVRGAGVPGAAALECHCQSITCDEKSAARCSLV